MSGQDALFPLEFFIEGTPKSFQAGARSREAWKETVESAARARVEETVDWSMLDERRLAVTIFYFAPGRMQGDIDNIVKPILDGMLNVAYLDDKVIERVLVQKFEPDVRWTFNDPSQRLAEALRTALPVTYVRVDDDLGWRTL